MSHPHYKLTYFDARGVAEPLRFIFAYEKIPYEDIRLAREDWPALKPKMPFQQLPVLEIDGKQYGQSLAFIRFVAKKYKLAGTSDEEMAHVDAISDYVKDIMASIFKFWFEPDQAKKEKLREEYVKGQFHEQLDVLEKHLTGYGHGKFFAPSGVTFADFLVASLMYNCQKYFTGALDKHEHLKAHAERIDNLPGIKEWIATRPQTEN